MRHAGSETESTEVLCGGPAVDTKGTCLLTTTSTVQDPADAPLPDGSANVGVAKAGVAIGRGASEDSIDASHTVTERAAPSASAAIPSSSTASVPVAPAAQQQRLEVAAAAVLVHAAGCTAAICPVPHCNKMRKIHTHFLECRHASSDSSWNLRVLLVPRVVCPRRRASRSINRVNYVPSSRCPLLPFEVLSLWSLSILSQSS